MIDNTQYVTFVANITVPAEYVIDLYDLLKRNITDFGKGSRIEADCPGCGQSLDTHGQHERKTDGV